MVAPKLTKEEALELIKPFNRTEKVIFLAIRGYYKDMGIKDVNDIGIYDDPIFIIAHDFFKEYNGNTDPSAMRVGIATVKAPQVLFFTLGIHGVSHSPTIVVDEMIRSKKDNPKYPRTYWAFRQAENVIVNRKGSNVDYIDNPANRFWIDLHCGGNWTTSSEGCQTIIKPQWSDFKQNGYELTNRYGQKKIPYILIEG